MPEQAAVQKDPQSRKELRLRYGSNPHQTPARAFASNGHLPLSVLNGGLSYINLLDALGSWQLVTELRRTLGIPAAASFKHTSPAGAAVSVPLTPELSRAYFVGNESLSPLATAYARARGADRLCSYGDWAALSDVVDVPTAMLLRQEVSDGVIAPGFQPEALRILKEKKGGRYPIVAIDPDYTPPESERRSLFGITLEQSRNAATIDDHILTEIVTLDRQLPEEARRDLLVATITVKYTQSNSVVLAVDGQAVGVGAGQQSRVHCVRLAVQKARTWRLRQHPNVLDLRFRRGLSRPERDNAVEAFIRDDITTADRESLASALEFVPDRLSTEAKQEWCAQSAGVAMSSDGYLPFRDNIDVARQGAVKFIVQPGGSARDSDVIEAANQYGMVMAFSGLRLFTH